MIEQIVRVCDFDPGYWLVFGPNVGPLQYYSHLPIIVIALALGLYILFQNYRALPHRVLFGIIVCFSLWVFFDSIIWATNRSDVIMFMWSLQILIEPLVYIGALILLYVLVDKRPPTFAYLSMWAAMFLPLAALTPTSYVLESFDRVSCLANETFFSYYSYAIEALFVAWILVFAGDRLWRARHLRERTEIILLTVGILLFLIAFAWGNVIGSFTGDWQLAQFGLFGMPVFIGFLAYSTIQFKTLNTQMVGSVVLILGLVALSFSLIFVQDVTVFRGVAMATFVFVLVFSAFLIRTILRDIETRKQIERLAHELELANRGQESLIHFVSHEVKGVLGKCINVMSMVVDGDYGPVSEQIHTLLKRGLIDTRAAVDMVFTILLSANIKSGAIKFNFTSFDFREGVRVALRELADDARLKNLELIFESDQRADYTITGDRDMLLKHVVRNLIDNAIRYTLKGSITIRLEREPTTLHFSITDTGVGINTEDMARLFTEGGKGRDSTRVNVNSTGYGLFFARQLIEKHRGTIWAESKGEGHGSTFHVRLPFSQSL